MTALLAQVLAALVGAAVGSFLNVVVHRLPRTGESIVRPRSRCPSCGVPIRARDNLPVVSWLLLRGRCRACGARISLRYPLVEALTALLFVLVLRRAAADPAHVPAAAEVALLLQRWLFVGALVALAFIDLEHRILPDAITKPGIVAGLVLSLAAPSGVDPWIFADLTPSPRGAAVLASACGAVVGAGTIWGIGAVGRAVFRKEAMGLGDVKLMGMVGAFLGPIPAVFAILLACVAGAVGGIAVWLATRSRYLAFGPYLALGAVVWVLAGDAVRDFVTVTYPAWVRGVLGSV